MNRRITITVDENTSDEVALRAVLAAVSRGRLSRMLCFLLAFFSMRPSGNLTVFGWKKEGGGIFFSVYTDIPKERAS